MNLGHPLSHRALLMGDESPVREQKQSDANFTPDGVAQSPAWDKRSARERLLDSSCGGADLLPIHRNCVCTEQNLVSATDAGEVAHGVLVLKGDFVVWASQTTEHFKCAAGNPPVIGDQAFKGQCSPTRSGASSAAWRPGLWTQVIMGTASCRDGGIAEAGSATGKPLQAPTHSAKHSDVFQHQRFQLRLSCQSCGGGQMETHCEGNS